MRINTSPEFFGKKNIIAYRDNGLVLAKCESYPVDHSDMVEKEFMKVARKAEELLQPGEVAELQWTFHLGNIRDYDIEITDRETLNYLVTVMIVTRNNQEREYHLEERFYPNSGAPFSTEEYPGTDQTQINIFGKWKTLSGALKDYEKFGTCTTKGRKPKEIYV